MMYTTHNPRPAAFVSTPLACLTGAPARTHRSPLLRVLLIALAVLLPAWVQAALPAVDNATGATNIQSVSATLNGTLTSTGALPTTVRVYWGATDGGTTIASWANVTDQGVTLAGPLVQNLTGLIAGRTYFYRFYATNGSGEAWATPSASFTTTTHSGPAILDLLTTAHFTILAGAAVTSGPGTIDGDVGLYPIAGSAMGIPPVQVNGTIYERDATGTAAPNVVIDPVLLLAAKNDLITAMVDAAGRTPVPSGLFLNPGLIPGSADIGGMNLAPGLYKFDTTALITTDVTLTGGANDVWIFQIGTSLSVASGMKVILAGGARASNIFWQVGTSATMFTGSSMQGTILADQSITLQSGSTMTGRALASSGQVAFAGNGSSNPINAYTIAASTGSNGSVTPAGTTSVLAGATPTYAIVPLTGYQVVDVLVDGLSVGATTTYTFAAIADTHTISATFQLATFTIFASAGNNGSVTPAGTSTVNYGATPTYAIMPNTGYHVADVLVDGSTVGAVTSYTFAAVTANHTISASFASDTFTIAATTGGNGSVTPAGTSTVNYGATPTYAIVPNTGYHVADVLVDGSTVGAVTSYTFAAVTVSHTISASFAADALTIFASSGANGSVTPAGTSTVILGATTTYAIVPNTGYNVADVLVDGSSVGAVTSYSFAAVTVSHTISATFGLGIYTIVASNGANGSVTPAGTSTVTYGATPTYAIVPNTGYNVADVLVDGSSVGAVTSYSFAAVSANHTISASFGLGSYTIVASNGANGSVTPAGTSTVTYGATPTYAIVPNTGYNVADVLVDGSSVGAVTSYSFAAVTVSHRISATFGLGSYTIVASNGANGSVTPAGTSTVTYGATPTYAIVPNTGYNVADVLVDGSSVGAVTSYSFAAVSANHTISASFGLGSYTIVASNGANGSVTPAGTSTVTYGATPTYAIVPNTGYNVADVLVDGSSVGAVTSYSFAAVSANHTISASFGLGSYTIVASNGANGSVTPAGTSTVTYGATPTYAIVPNTGYNVADVLVDGSSVGAVTTYTFAPIAANHTISASFGLGSYTIVASSDANGTVSPAGTSTVSYGATPAYTMVPNTGYSVADVLVDGSSVGAVSSYTFAPVAANHTISATFGLGLYTIVASSGANGSVTPAGSTTAAYGATVTYSITPDTGYGIVSVLVDGTTAGTVAGAGTMSYAFTAISSNHTISATFGVQVLHLTGPTGMQTTARPTFTWVPLTGASLYDIVVVDLTNGQNAWLRNSLLTGTSWVPDGDPFTATGPLTFGHGFRAWIRASVGGVWTAWSVSLDFSLIPLGVPVLLGPSGVQATARPVVSWTAVLGATVYDVYVDDLSSDSTALQRDTSVVGTTWTSNSVTIDHNYRVWVRAGASGQWGPWSISMDFRTTDPKSPTMTGPVGAQATTTPTFTWNPTTSAANYDVYVTDDTTGESPVQRNPVVVGTSWIPATPLTAGHAYHAWVRARVADTFTGWSLTPVAFSIVAAGVPALTAPLGLQVPATPTFTWLPVAGATSYDVYVTDLTSGQDPVQRNQAAVGTSWTLSTPLLAGHAHRAYIRALVGGVYGGWSTPFYFSTAPLAVPQLTGPAPVEIGLTPTVTWNSVTGATTYDVYLRDLTTGASPAQRVTVAGTSWTTSALTFAHAYSVYVRAGAGGVWSEWSTNWDFSTSDATIPTLLDPNGESLTVSPAITWGAIPTATDFDLYLIDRTTGQSPVQRNVAATGTSWVPAPLTYGHAYRAYLRARVGGVYSAWSPLLDFTVAALGVPALTAPVGAQASNTPTITWTAPPYATTYDVYVLDVTTGVSPVQRNVAVSGTSWTPAALTRNHSYRVWVRASDSGQWGLWSKSLDFSVIALGANVVAPAAVTAAQVPESLSPAGAITELTPTFTWMVVLGADHYDVVLDDLTSGEVVVTARVAHVTHWQLEQPLVRGHAYRWQVRAIVGLDTSDWSDPQAFTIK